MSRLSRLVAAGVVAGIATLAIPTQAQAAPECVKEPCYQCVMYPCYPGDWAEFLRDRAGETVCNVAGC